MTRHFQTAILVFVLTNCGQNSVDNSREAEKDTLISAAGKNNNFDDSEFTVCYTEFSSKEMGGGIDNPQWKETGIIGEFKGKTLCYETWFIPNGNSLNINYLFLRTDTITVRNYDFCFPELPTEFSGDSVICKKFNDGKNEWIFIPSGRIDTIPTFIQPLIVALNGWQNFYRFNESIQQYSPKIYIKDNSLILQYPDYDQLNNYFIRRVYDHNGIEFKLTTTDTLETFSR